jgi:hypothetical protein
LSPIKREEKRSIDLKELLKFSRNLLLDINTCTLGGERRREGRESVLIKYKMSSIISQECAKK